MTIVLLVLTALAVAGIVGTLLTVRVDGRHRVPTIDMARRPDRWR